MITEPTYNPDSPGEPVVGRGLLDAALSLKCKATLLVVVLMVAVSASVSGYLLRSSGAVARNQHDIQMVHMASVLAKAAATAMTNDDPAGLQMLARDFANGMPLLYVIFSDADGRQLAVAEHGDTSMLRRLDRDSAERVPVPGRPVFRTGTDTVPVFLDVTYPITSRFAETGDRVLTDGTPPVKLLGYVRTGMIANNWQETMSSTLDLVIGVGIIATMAAIPLGFLLVRRTVLPLEGLGQMMIRFSQGDLDVRSPVRRRDEIGRLETAFNRMADQHQQTHERIIRLNAELERRVAQRTQQLRELASREPLTGLYNRRHFNETLARRFSEAMRYDADLSCIMIDLDGFKAVNDEFGHHIGDELLQLTANTITSELRTADVAARFGGDEFVVLLPHTDGERARVLAERIFEKFNQDEAERLPDLCATMSVGIASLKSLETGDSESLIRAADRALYSAKASGKNRIVTADEASKPAPI